MKLTTNRIANNVVTCELEYSELIDIDKQWVSSNIKVCDVIEFEYEKSE